MPVKKRPLYLDSPAKFWLSLLGLWVFFSVALGFYSYWVFYLIYPNHGVKLPISILYAAVYSTVLLGLFGLTWLPFHYWFPLVKTRNLVFHAAGQSVNFVVGYIAGFVIKDYVQVFFYGGMIDENVKYQEVAVSVLFCLIGVLFTNGLFYTRAYFRQSLEAEQGKTELELSALRAQINPHFLFNSLNSVAALIRTNPTKAEEVTEDLADLFRYTLRASSITVINLYEELEVARVYLNIEKARFKDRLTVEITAPEYLHDIKLPILTLQPLLENAIKHGVTKKDGKHMVKLHISDINRFIEIKVTDTGPGFSHRSFDDVLKQGTGIKNVFKRLQIEFAEKADGAILSDGIVLRFPVQK